jgi:hypothetical protein
MDIHGGTSFVTGATQVRRDYFFDAA